MATPTATPFLKSQPDVGKINTFEGILVTVTKHPGPRNTVGTTVVATKLMKKDELLSLPEKLQVDPGPGYYLFSATDAGGSGSDEWMTKLGPDYSEGQQMAGSNGAGGGFASPGAMPALGEGVIHLGHNFFYNQTMGTLTTPWGTIVSWKEGDPMPQRPVSASQPQQNTSPWWGQPTMPGIPSGLPVGMPGWGGYSAINETESPRLKQLETQLADERRRREMDDLKNDQRRQQEETNKRIEEQAKTTREMFERLISTLTAKPTGPDETVLRLERQLEETKRQNAEIQARAETREREDRLRADMKAQYDQVQAMIREMGANKTDPMLPLLMNMMTQQQAQAADAVKAIQSATSTASSASERNVQQMIAQLQNTIMSPVQLVDMMQRASSSGSEGQKMIVESLRDSMNMQREVFTQLLDVSNQGGQPPWVGVVQSTLDRIGSIGQALANRPVVQQQAPAQRQPPAAQRPTQQQAPIVTPPPVQKPHLASVPRPAEATSAAAGTTAPQAAAPAGKIKKGRRKKGTEAEIIPGTQRREGYTIEEMKEAKPSDIREVTKGIADEQFFAEIYPYIKMLRDQVQSGLTPEGATEMILRNRGEIQAAGIFPPAVQLLYSEQIEVLVERILPASDAKYQASVVELIEAQLVAEAEGTEGDEEDDGEGE